MGTKEKKNSAFLMQGAVLAAAGMITRLIGMAYRIPLANILGDDGQGYYNYAFQIYNLALLLTSYSLPLAVSKLVSARVAKGEQRNAYRILKGALLFAVFVGAAVALIIYFGADFIASNLFVADLSAYALRVLAPCLLIVAVMGVMRGYFQGLGTMVPTAISQVLEQIVNAVVSIVAASYLLQMGKEVAKAKKNDMIAPAYGAAGGTLGTLAGAVFALLFVFFIFAVYKKVLKRQVRRDRTRHTESYSQIFMVLLMTIAPVILSTAIYNISESLDSMMFSKIMSIQGHSKKEYISLMGMFAKYNTLVNIPLAMANALGASIIPSLTAAVAAGKRKQIHSKINLAIRFDMLIAIPSCIGFLVLAKPIITLLYPSGNIEITSKMLQLGAISVIFYCLSTITNAILQGLNKMTVPVKNAAISLVIHLLSLFVMLVVLKWGIYAVIIGNVIFSLSMCILNAKAVRQAVAYNQEIKKTFLIPALAAVIMGAFALLVYLLFDLLAGVRIAAVIAIIAAIPAYGISLLKLGGLSVDEILTMPKGTAILSLCRKMHLLKEEID